MNYTYAYLVLTRHGSTPSIPALTAVRSIFGHVPAICVANSSDRHDLRNANKHNVILSVIFFDVDKPGFTES